MMWMNSRSTGLWTMNLFFFGGFWPPQTLGDISGEEPGAKTLIFMESTVNH